MSGEDLNSGASGVSDDRNSDEEVEYEKANEETLKTVETEFGKAVSKAVLLFYSCFRKKMLQKILVYRLGADLYVRFSNFIVYAVVIIALKDTCYNLFACKDSLK